MKLCDFVISASIIPDLRVGSKEDAIKAMVTGLREAGSIKAADEAGIVAAILKREELGSTGIGRGVAVPHTKHPSVDKLIAAIALLPDGVDFASLDGEPVYIMFLLVSPPRSARRSSARLGKHLAAPAERQFLQVPAEVQLDRGGLGSVEGSGQQRNLIRSAVGPVESGGMVRNGDGNNSTRDGDGSQFQRVAHAPFGVDRA